MDQENRAPHGEGSTQVNRRATTAVGNNHPKKLPASAVRRPLPRRGTTTSIGSGSPSTASRRTTTSQYLRRMEESTAPIRTSRFRATSSFTSASTSRVSRLAKHKTALSLSQTSRPSEDDARQMRTKQSEIEQLQKLMESVKGGAPEVKKLLESYRTKLTETEGELKTIEGEVAEKIRLLHQAKLNAKTLDFQLQQASMISEDDVDEWRRKASEAEETLRNVKNDYGEAKEAHDELEKQQTFERIELETKQADVKRLEEEIDTLRRKQGTFGDDCARYKAEVCQLEANVAKFESDRDHVLGKIANCLSRVAELESKIGDVLTTRKSLQSEINALRALYEEAITSNEKMETEIKTCRNQETMSKATFEQRTREVIDKRVEMEEKYTATITKLEKSLEETEKSLAEKLQINETNKKQLEENAEELSRLLEENEMLYTEEGSRNRENEEKGQKIESDKKHCRELELGMRDLEKERRKLHNEVMELKGNIRVFCRVRPFLGSEPQENKPDFSFDDDGALGAKPPRGYRTDEQMDFKFDYVFGPKASQSEVFMEISQLVQSALDGYRVCIFAYGQTGSGKTHTMIGDKTDKQMGMIPRAVRQVFEKASLLEKDSWKFEFKASFIEIYNETCRDLLQSARKLELKMDPRSNRVDVPGLCTEEVKSTWKVLELIERANKNRATAATAANERSSRSHSVFVLHISATHSETGEVLEGALNLVDLAGSERLENSKVEGARLRETQAINTSLSALSNVIVKLSDRNSKHVPFRNSKLTALLRESLVGRSKVLMFVNISPQAASFQETVCSLRFARTVNACHVGTATRNSSSGRAR